jgi:hypothetical protein
MTVAGGREFDCTLTHTASAAAGQRHEPSHAGRRHHDGWPAASAAIAASIAWQVQSAAGFGGLTLVTAQRIVRPRRHRLGVEAVLRRRRRHAGLQRVAQQANRHVTHR